MPQIETDRLTIRPPVEDDRARFVELFTDPAFTVFADGTHDVESANARFDHMRLVAVAIPYAKQPVIVRQSGTIIGYTGGDASSGRPNPQIPQTRWCDRSVPVGLLTCP
jgi:hypothetical protein